jgi:hypothetical protein
MEICKSFPVRALLVLLAIYIRFEADWSQLQNMGILDTLDTYLFREYHETI